MHLLNLYRITLKPYLPRTSTTTCHLTNNYHDMSADTPTWQNSLLTPTITCQFTRLSKHVSWLHQQLPQHVSSSNRQLLHLSVHIIDIYHKMSAHRHTYVTICQLNSLTPYPICQFTSLTLSTCQLADSYHNMSPHWHLLQHFTSLHQHLP